MLIAHISDNHGGLIPIPECDIIVHSGDLLPNNPFIKDFPNEPKYQSNWISHRKKKIKNWIGDKPFLFCSGNHDFINVQEAFCSYGIKAISLNNRIVEFAGLSFYGFPYIPYDEGRWKFEKTIPEMTDMINLMKSNLKEYGKKLDILVCHCPPYGYMDFDNGKHWGNSVLSNWLHFSDECNLPKYIMFGHVHSSYGIEKLECFENITLSNAATTINKIEV